MRNNLGIKRCTIERDWYYGTMYYWKDVDTGKESRAWNTEEECLDNIKKNGYTIQYKNRNRREK